MKTIVWDVDDVLNNLMREWLDGFWLPQHPDCKVTYEQIRENPPHQVLNIPMEKYLASIDAFRSAAGSELSPAPSAMDWFRTHGHKARHAVLTAVPLRAADIWAGWVIKHFGQWVRSFNFVPSFREAESLPTYDHTKGEFLKWWSAGHVLVDDNVASIEGAKALGIATVLVPQPWNRASGSLKSSLEELTSLIQ